MHQRRTAWPCGAAGVRHAPRTSASHCLSAKALVSLSSASDSRFDSAGDEDEDMAGAAARACAAERWQWKRVEWRSRS